MSAITDAHAQAILRFEREARARRARDETSEEGGAAMAMRTGDALVLVKGALVEYSRALAEQPSAARCPPPLTQLLMSSRSARVYVLRALRAMGGTELLASLLCTPDEAPLRAWFPVARSRVPASLIAMCAAAPDAHATAAAEAGEESAAADGSSSCSLPDPLPDPFGELLAGGVCRGGVSMCQHDGGGSGTVSTRRRGGRHCATSIRSSVVSLEPPLRVVTVALPVERTARGSGVRFDLRRPLFGGPVVLALGRRRVPRQDRARRDRHRDGASGRARRS